MIGASNLSEMKPAAEQSRPRQGVSMRRNNIERIGSGDSQGNSDFSIPPMTKMAQSTATDFTAIRSHRGILCRDSLSAKLTPQLGQQKFCWPLTSPLEFIANHFARAAKSITSFWLTRDEKGVSCSRTVKPLPDMASETGERRGPPPLCGLVQ